MGLYEDLLQGCSKLSLIGLGYVGMPIAVAFAKHVPVIGFDLNRRKIDLYRQGIDPTEEVGEYYDYREHSNMLSRATKIYEQEFLICS